jgi:ABC-type bacteriocin/lantibiotic exporter with double-glycine peptidase domain
MILESIGKQLDEAELSKIVEFKPIKGFSPKMMDSLCEIINLEYEYHFDSSLEEIRQTIEAGFYPIVLVNPSILYNLPEEEHGHYIIVKDITEEKVIINDPDQEYGGEDKEVAKERFLDAWKNRYSLIFVIKGEKK